MDQQPSFIKSWSSDPLVLVPTTPVLDVCAVYDMVNETLQIIESSWNEVVCKNSQKLLIAMCTWIDHLQQLLNCNMGMRTHSGQMQILSAKLGKLSAEKMVQPWPD